MSISEYGINNRREIINLICNKDDNFKDATDAIELLIEEQVETNGIIALQEHLQLCGTIPELFPHDSSEEKLYSKYTDILLSMTFNEIGFESLVLTERADVADVEVFSKKYNFVADAKAFRLSRTAKNQKDFKIQALDNWKHGKPFAMLVAPIFQLPTKTSQIYQQSSVRNVCIFTYTHLSLLLNYSQQEGSAKAIELLHNILKIIPALNPSKNANDYWLAINQSILNYSKKLSILWQYEKDASCSALELSKKEGLEFLAKDRERVMSLSKSEAIKELLKLSKIESKIKTIQSASSNILIDLV